jgi:hypothetical protein
VASTVFVNGVTLTQASWFQDVDNIAYQYLSGVAGTNAITATGPAGLGAYAAGLKFRFIPAATNTGATTINITGTAALGARSIFAGGLALTGGELKIGVPCEIFDDGTQFEISAPFSSSGLWTPSLGGNTTYTSRTGLYRILGNTAFIFGQMTVNQIGTGSVTTISGLPIAANASLGGGVLISFSTSVVTTVTALQGNIPAGTSTIVIWSRTAAAVSDSANNIFQNGTIMNFSGLYPI